MSWDESNNVHQTKEKTKVKTNNHNKSLRHNVDKNLKLTITDLLSTIGTELYFDAYMHLVW